ncbi:FAD:protein FMN transferase [Calycomorphotria hydatis]|uniref:FAD:protein FMN transferase n=1 Tax=Calycomorphotria hydatis TaxID=2528027 RepID=A0A517T7T4_9PLAN|nr:FAD:protein FMN transferase [Calycomorphotria hydatis]QDT64436.1 Thiamine biosynthesis lipoprotein ApbE precursor [Calycomorphotria hydatis]
MTSQQPEPEANSDGTNAVPETNRRHFLTGEALRQEAERTQEALADAVLSEVEEDPTAGPTIRLSTRAMACEFSAIMNPGPASQVMHASDALDLIHLLEQKMTVYREDADLAVLNRDKPREPTPIDAELFEVLNLAREISEQTDGAFDPSSAAQIQLWNDCRNGNRLPTEHELANVLDRTGMWHFELSKENNSIAYLRDDVELNLGGIGKGFALDKAAEHLEQQEIEGFLLHGGHSSILARGTNGTNDGWPVGIGNPLFTSKRFGTLILRDQAMSTSGSNLQFFRHAGKRYGHILDPRTAQPAEGLLSAVVLAPSAAMADALSTAFFVLGLEKSVAFCDTHMSVSALLIPYPRRGGRLEFVNCGIPDEKLFLDEEQIETT